MQAQEIFKLIIDANKNAYDNTWNAVNNFQEKAEEAMKSAFDKAPLHQEVKDAARETIDAYKSIIKQVLDTNKTVYDNMVKTIETSQEKAEKMAREYFDAMPLPEEAKKVVLTTMGLYKESCSEIKKAVEENYTKIEESLES
jgi:hypothetical protein